METFLYLLAICFNVPASVIHMSVAMQSNGASKSCALRGASHKTEQGPELLALGFPSCLIPGLRLMLSKTARERRLAAGFVDVV